MLAMKGGGEPRAHHFVPQCWLAGFTASGEKEDRLWVTDIRRQKQWLSSPEGAGHRRDFYRTGAPGLDPNAFEKSYGMYESAVAPTLKILFREKRMPTLAELEDLLVFMALQWVRVPAFRPTFLDLFDGIMRDKFRESLQSPEIWASAMEEAGIPPSTPGASSQEMKEFLDSGEMTLNARTELFLVESFKAMETIVPALRQRAWEARVSPSGSFIGSDNPVVLDGKNKELVGFSNADIVAYPVNRHVLLCSTSGELMIPRMTRREIARMNTLMMLWSDEQIYSTVPDFCWSDADGHYQTDWNLFNRDAILRKCQLPESLSGTAT